MTRSQQMVVLSTMFGAVLAVLAMTAESAVGPFAVIGGAIVGLGWAFYARGETEA